MSDLPEDIEWPDFKPGDEMICHCRCGAVYRSFAKSAQVEGRWRGVTQKTCPGCGSYINCNRLQSDPEIMSLGGD